MNTTIIEFVAAHPLVISIGWTLIHFVWQASLVAVVTAIALGTMRRSSASVRYIVACSGLAVMTIAPTGTFAWLVSVSIGDDWKSIGQQTATALSDDERHDLNSSSIGELTVSKDLSDKLLDHEISSQPGLNKPENSVVGGVVGKWFSTMDPFARAIQRWLPWCVVLWIGGVICLAIRLLAGLRRVWFWKSEGVEVTDGELVMAFSRLAGRMKLRRKVRLLETARESVPAVIGWLRPAILAPASMLTGLTTAEMESILAHELAHVRRHDYLVNLLQTVVETMLFYHPAVWWLSGQIRAERENCCDDIAVEVCGNRVAFARALTRLEELRCKHDRLSVAADGGSLVHRIRRIVLAKPHCNASWWPAGAIVLASLAVLASSSLMSVATSDVSESGVADKAGPAIGENGTSATDAIVDSNQPENDEYSLHKPEIGRVDAKTGQSQRVLADVKLLVGERPPVLVDMKFSNLFNYTLIPERIARELQSVELGVIDFGERPQPKNDGQPLAIDWQLLVPPPSGTDTKPVEKPGAAESVEEVVTVDQLAEPAGDRRIVPYAEDAIWIPDHLAFYGQNQKGQTRFRVVRIDKVDLGIGPIFGPVNALVIDDASTDLGVLGSNWARIPRGKNGERFVWAAVGGFYFMAFPDATPQNPDANDEIEKVLAKHTYDLARRESAGWVEVNGVGMPIAAGVDREVQDVSWGPLAETSGLQSRLTLQTENPAVGKPLWFKLELRNSGEKPTEVDLQNYAPFRVLRAGQKQPDGTIQSAQFIGMTPQTSSGDQELAPGEVITVWENVDATTLFLLDQETYQFFAKGAEWAKSKFVQDSNQLEVRLQPGQLPPQQALIASLSSLETRPKGWTVSTGFDVIYLSHSPTNLKRDVTTIQLWFTKEPLPADYQLGEGPDRQEVTTIALCELGHLHVAAPPGAKELWPEYVRDIRIAAARALNLNAKQDSTEGVETPGAAASLEGN